ncbi:hypothetical protein CY34DRAFT_439850 [Suillus luteus UH-Slu-Lm8-n1]|uniref:SAGA-associated factor 11 n=1 Tax=Suillus luteus UH-Slu-Lm8-n1 TaxID=930992 RepID=A0A0D0AX12_9AGAM|nr:hypothetical protein CY34DRAFT_439850 [Suillus luteus UH-Slu-Lm8-n1]
MSKTEREDAISAITSKLFSAMLDDLAMDAALQAHHQLLRSRAVCRICHTRCGLVHPNGAQTVTPQSQSILHGDIGGKTASSTGTNTPNGSKPDGNIFFECMVCKRQVASNRFAPHLSACMGTGTGSRRAAPRGTNLKAKIPIEPGRSASPYPGSENGNVSDDNSNGKGKAKGKGKRAGNILLLFFLLIRERFDKFVVDDADFNLKRKRPISPQTSPTKKPTKKLKTAGSPVSRLKAEPDSSGTTASSTLQVPSSSSQSKVPSKLRSSSTASFLERDRSSTPGSQSSVGTPIASTSSAISARSVAGTGPPKRGRPKGSKTGTGRGALAAQQKRPSPPRPLLPPPPPPPPAPAVRIEQDYLVGRFNATSRLDLYLPAHSLMVPDVEGDETGSSTDTDG